MDLNGIGELVKQIGFPGLIFAVWYIYHRNQSKQWADMIQQQAANWQQLIVHIEKKNDQTFELLKDSMTTIQAHTMILARIENKVDSMRGSRHEVDIR